MTTATHIRVSEAATSNVVQRSSVRMQEKQVFLLYRRLIWMTATEFLGGLYATCFVNADQTAH